MTQDEMIELAREALKQEPREDWNSTAWVFADETLQAFAKLVAEKVAERYMQLFLDSENQPTQFGTATQEYREQEIREEREACAKMCEEYAIGLERNYSEIIADKIRARGQPMTPEDEEFNRIEMESRMAQPEPKYRRGNRLICLETEEYCVIHISGTDRQWVKFPDSHIGVYTNEQVAELFDLLPKEPEQEPVAYIHRNEFNEYRLEPTDNFKILPVGVEMMLYTTPPQRKPLSDEEMKKIWYAMQNIMDWYSFQEIARAIEAAHGIKE